VHEWGAVTAAVQTAAAQLTGHAVAAELRISASVDPDVARLAFAAATAGTPLAGATLRVQRLSHELACLDCSRRYPGTQLTPCPDCGGNGLITRKAPDAEVRVITPPGPPQESTP
jgi:Zn finger protein HypA/HybF involved in hydrogenase expression